MAAAKKNTSPAAEPAQAEEQAKIDVLSGLVDRDARTYTMQKTVTMNGAGREGTFRFRYPTVADRLRQGVLQSRFLGGTRVETLDVSTYNIAFAMSFLASISMELPPWFKYEQMESVEELLEMFEEVNAFVESFRRTDAAASNAGDSEDAAGAKAVAGGEDAAHSTV